MSYKKLIDGYKKKEYNLQRSRTTKLAKWAYLQKEGGFLSFSSPSTFVYFIDGDVKLAHINDFVKRLIKLYDDGALDSSDEAIFSHSGTLDSREFRKLARGSMLEDAYKIIKIKKLKSEKPAKTEKAKKSTKARRKSLRKAEKTMILDSQHHKCADCKMDISKMSQHFDHRIPLALGGSNDLTNIQALCPNCHARKSQRDQLAIAKARR